MKKTPGPRSQSLSAKLAALAAAKRLVEQHERQLSEQLAGLPEYYGFPSLEAFAAAIAKARKAIGMIPQSTPRFALDRPSSPTPPVMKRRTRRPVTPAMQVKLKQLVTAGKTDKEVAAILKMSVPNVYVYKKQLGLVGLGKARKKAAPKVEKKP